VTVATAIAVFALVVSLLTAWVLLHAQREVVRSETVTSIFEGFRRLAELRSFFWQAAHVLDTPETYDRTVSQLRTALAETPPAVVAELLVKERAAAIAAIQIFEESLYHYEQARRQRDREQAKFLEEMLVYYTERLLLNPRLLYLWSPEGGNVRADFEPPTRAYYDEHVDVPEESAFDDRGPYPAGSEPA
jgi:hypothetical protein